MSFNVFLIFCVDAKLLLTGTCVVKNMYGFTKLDNESYMFLLWLAGRIEGILYVK